MFFKRFGVDTIYHAAAYKHVPMVNTEGVDDNIFGTLNCAQVAIDTGVETLVLISTDKPCDRLIPWVQLRDQLSWYYKP